MNVVDLRDFGEGRWRKVDDRPYGGGPGMLMKCGPWFAAVESRLAGTVPGGRPARVVMTTPAGRRFDQRAAEELAQEGHIVFLCGHYEGFDARIETLATDKMSLGDFVMTVGVAPRGGHAPHAPVPSRPRRSPGARLRATAAIW